MKRFLDRREAGRFLAGKLDAYRGSNCVVLALPRGGVPAGFEVAQALHAPLDVFLVRKLGFPGHEEFALGAIASGGVRVINPAALRLGDFTEEEIDEITAREQQELERRELEYRGNRAPVEVRGRIAILIDDGLATGSTMRAAAIALRQLGPSRTVMAVPVASSEACDLLSREVDDAVCGRVPDEFVAVGRWYQNFGQTSDEEVQHLLHLARGSPHFMQWVDAPATS